VYTQASPINSPHNTDFRWLDLSDTKQLMAYLIADRGIDFRLNEHGPRGVRVHLNPISLVRQSEFCWLRVKDVQAHKKCRLPQSKGAAAAAPVKTTRRFIL
jgi:hypothetical protein